MPSSAAFEAESGPPIMQRAGAIARAGQAGGARERQRPGRDRKRQVPARVERPGIRVAQGDAIARRGREDQSADPGPRRRDCVGTSRLALRSGRDFGGIAPGSVAVAVTMGSSAGGLKGTSKSAWPWLSVVTSSDPR